MIDKDMLPQQLSNVVINLKEEGNKDSELMTHGNNNTLMIAIIGINRHHMIMM